MNTEFYLVLCDLVNLGVVSTPKKLPNFEHSVSSSLSES